MSKEEIKEGMKNVAGGVKHEPESEPRRIGFKLPYGGPCIEAPKFPAMKYGGPCIGVPKLHITPSVKPKEQPDDYPNEPLTPRRPVNSEK